MYDPIWLESGNLSFPPPQQALKEPNGLLAAGGDLSLERILAAYKLGIFPWYEAGQPIMWWSPDPRMVLFPEDLHISKSLNKTINKQLYQVTSNQHFSAVIAACSEQRGKNREGTWITDEMQSAYINLHKEGWAHSVEAWQDNKLVGGLYGLAIGEIFYGESMFSISNNASKIAFVSLAQSLQKQGFKIIDCQISSKHLASLGAQEITRVDFMKLISANKHNKLKQPFSEWPI